MLNAAADAIFSRARSVRLFVTCLIDTFRPAVAVSAGLALDQYGVEIDVPERQTCCGQPAFNAGVWDDARAMARATIDCLDGDDRPVVIPSGSCGDMVIHQYPMLLGDDPHYGPRARALSERTLELSQFLAARARDTAPTPSPEPPSAVTRVTYHASCHLLRGLGERTAPTELLEQCAHAKLIPLPGAEECCGFGGLFSVKMSDISGAMLRRKLDAIVATGADAVVSCDLGCLLHIEGGLRRRGSQVRALHLAQVLDV
jgi:L-lactate dehydrogenase complex protein LldE